MFNFNIIEKLKIIFNFNKKKSQGGDGGELFIAARKMIGDGKITANGGDGDIAGKGGKVTIISENNKFKGEISAKGGKST